MRKQLVRVAVVLLAAACTPASDTTSENGSSVTAGGVAPHTLGWKCHNNSDWTCNDGLYCEASTGRCTAQLPNGTTCGADDFMLIKETSCLSSYCDPSSNTCASPLGASCNNLQSQFGTSDCTRLLGNGFICRPNEESIVSSDPSNPDEFCLPLGVSGDRCFAGSSDECASGFDCVPDNVEGSVMGFCTGIGSVPVGGACQVDITCTAGNVCIKGICTAP
jgi:hypothetical protein